MTKHILAFVLLVASAFATTVTGTTKDPSTGNLFNGSISFSLNYNGGRQISTNQVLIVPRPAPQYTISNGVIPSGLTVVGNDDISPSKTVYLVAWFDLYGALVRVSPYSITGSTFDLGTAIPTPITTSNVSVLDLIGLRTLSVTGASNLATSSGRVGIGTSSPVSQLANTASNNLDAAGVGSLGTNGFSWQANASGGYAANIANIGGAGTSYGLLVTSSSGSGKIITAHYGQVAAQDVWGVSTLGMQNNGLGHKHIRVASCTTAAGVGAICTTTITWGTTFVDANYTVTCSFLDQANQARFIYMQNQLAASVQVVIESLGGAASGTFHCNADHDP